MILSLPKNSSSLLPRASGGGAQRSETEGVLEKKAMGNKE